MQLPTRLHPVGPTVKSHITLPSLKRALGWFILATLAAIMALYTIVANLLWPATPY
jgi:hypothetical protein